MSKSGSLAEGNARPTVRLGRHLEKTSRGLRGCGNRSGAALGRSVRRRPDRLHPVHTPFALNHQNQGPTFTTLDLNNDGVPDFTFAMSSTAHFSSIGYTTRFKLYMKVVPDETGNQVVQGSLAPTASAVPQGSRSGRRRNLFPAVTGAPSLQPLRGHRQNSGTWQKVEFAYVGLKFLINGQVHYGWAAFKSPIRRLSISQHLRLRLRRALPTRPS